MAAHRLSTVVENDGTILLKDLPFHQGERVEVIVIQESEIPAVNAKPYPLRGTPYNFEQATEPVAPADWQLPLLTVDARIVKYPHVKIVPL